jgi:hypothetical protein
MTSDDVTRRMLLGGTVAFGATSSIAAAPPIAANVHQMRIYEIFEHNKLAFHSRFRDHAMRIMKRHRFRIVDMWEASGTTGLEFVYILAWSGEQAMNECWANFMRDDEWSRIKRETSALHGLLVGKIDQRVMRRLAHSPALVDQGFARI